jgi:hypothetical protein
MAFIDLSSSYEGGFFESFLIRRGSSTYGQNPPSDKGGSL